MPWATSRSSSSTVVSPSATASIWATASGAPDGSIACAVRARRLRETRCCCTPSCRSRSMRRRVASAVATIRAREAVSCAWASALATAVATSSVKLASCSSVFAGSVAPRDAATITPHSRPSTSIGAPTAECMPAASAAAGAAPASGP